MSFDPAPEEDERITTPKALQSGPQIDNSDIYRGNPPSSGVIRSWSLDSLVSSSESFGGRGRLGAIAAVVELAISRWARGNRLGSSSSSSSETSSITLSRSQRARLRRRWSSTGTLQIAQSEHDFAAHISRIKAREESRQTPRHFALYLPPYILVEQPHAKSDTRSGEHARRIISTTSLPLVLSQLGSALKTSAKARRSQVHTHIPKYLAKGVHISYRDHPKSKGNSGDTNDLPKAKDKRKTAPPAQSVNRTSAKKAWFLDVASPTWEDMRAIGKLLHLHPLTLEDILQRDPREKLELFPKLGYYFISFRAIEGQTARDKRMAKESDENYDPNQTAHDSNGSVLGEANVYLVVFNEGICTFHFTDISEHTDRIRNRIVLLEEALNMSSDWIAHGILDSIVDSFYPFLAEIEKEVIAIDNLVFANSLGSPDSTEKEVVLDKPAMEGNTSLHCEVVGKHGAESLELKERYNSSITNPTPRLLSAPKFTLNLYFPHLGFVFTRYPPRSSLPPSQLNTTHMTIRRMAKTRRLVTSLVRLLSSKSEVVSQIRKRLLTSSLAGLGNGTSKYDDIEVAIYMGDVQDHILFLQHSLAHYERMLSQSHPTYLSQLRTVVALTKNGTDKAIIYLTVVSVAVLCVQTLIGAFSLNITVPTNDHSPDGSYHVFGIVIALASLILGGYLSVVRWWWIQAKRRRGAVL
ncbi:hypothetical protein BDZ94DRAFT_285980 [Collybia nuda]|uniref:Uncharacterized protein n=1 Tax=Collybia nuda TaxID=64659 RepID=A0A9P6CDH0_9AGAR|nr:hypothetical protein BDZ94DRAFT_285980 [Collybia nuda]